MAARKKKYVEVLTPRVKCFSQNDSEITFSDILFYMSGKTVYYTLIPQHYSLTLFISA